MQRILSTLALALLCVVTHAGAQETVRSRATVTGEATEAESGDPVASAYITVEGTTLAAITDSGGQYRITRVPPGPQVLAVRRLGYAPVRVPLTVPASGVLVQNVVLARSVLRLPTVVTTGDAAGRARGELGTASVIDRPTIAARQPMFGFGRIKEDEVHAGELVGEKGCVGCT